jgi:hypothetical protein
MNEQQYCQLTILHCSFFIFYPLLIANSSAFLAHWLSLYQVFFFINFIKRFIYLEEIETKTVSGSSPVFRLFALKVSQKLINRKGHKVFCKVRKE